MLTKGVTTSTAALVALLLVLLAPVRAASESAAAPYAPDGNWRYAVAVGVLDHDIDLDWASRTFEGGTDYNVEVLVNQSLYDDVPFGVINPNFGVTINDQGDTSRIYAGALWQVQLNTSLLFNLGMGLAVHDGNARTSDPEDKDFGARVVFRMPIEVGYAFNERHRLFLVLEHMSNGSLANPNHGMDAAGIRYRYRFR